nr:recombinase family protein [uncultured Caproiciproducens sp.]
MKIAAAYIRVSTDDQMEYSPDSQLEKIREYAKNNDMILPEEFVFREDEGISGKKAEKRPEFMHMIGTAKKKPKPFDVIIVWKFSRFARNRQDSIVYKSMLRKQCDIDIISVTEQLGDDKMSIIVEAMIEAMDEYYSINLAEEVRRGMNEKVSRGEPVTAPAFGYLIKDKKYYIDQDTAPLVRMIYTDYIAGMGYRAIATKLNTMGIRTKRGGLWENRTVEYILRNPVYIGKIRWNAKGKTRRNFDDPNIILIDGDHEQLIDNYTWQLAQARLLENKMMYGKYAGQKNPAAFLLQGLVKCSNCGSTLTRTVGTSMQCQAYAHGKCNVSHGVSISKLEEMVLTTLDMNIRYGNIPLVQKAVPKVEYEAEAIEKQILREKQKLIRVKEAYENGIDSLEEYRVNKQKITERIEQLQTEKPVRKVPPQDELIKKFRSAHKNTVKRLRDPKISVEEKNALLRTFIDKVVFDRIKCQIQIFYYI